MAAVSKRACGDESISGICVGGIVSKIRGTASLFSSSNSSSIFCFIPISSSSYSSSSNPNSNSNPNFNSNTNPISDSNSNSNSDSNGETMGLWLIFDLIFVVAPGIHLFIIIFCLLWRKVKAMMNSQKSPWRKEVHSWRIMQEQYFSRIFGHDFKLKISYPFQCNYLF